MERQLAPPVFTTIPIKPTPPIPGARIFKTCCRMGHGGCGMLVHVKDGQIIRVEGDPENPFNRGALCSKGLASIQMVYHPDRLKYALKRIGQRGEGKWEKISWDEALDTIAQKLSQLKGKYGPETVCIATGTDRGFTFHVSRFCNAFGTPNWIAPGGAQCFVPAMAGDIWTYGEPAFVPHYEGCPECIVLWGSQATVTNPSAFGGMIMWNKARGAKLVVIDPRFSREASKADLWLQTRPGTDTALALAWLNVIINEKLYDESFVEKWTVGFNKLAQHVQEYTPDKVAEITWVPEEIIRRSARMYATSKPAVIQWGVAVEHFPNSFDFARARAILRAITGNIDIPGGEIHLPPVPAISKWASEFQLRHRVPRGMFDKRLGAEKYKVLSRHLAHTPAVFEAVLTGKPYPIKAMLFWGCNGIAGFANLNEFMKVIKNLDFVVAVDRWMTPTAELADIVLPVTTFFEEDNVHDYQHTGRPLFTIRQKVIEPIGESRQDDEIFFALAKRLDLDYPWTTMEEFLDYQLEPFGLTFEEFKRREKGFIEFPMKYRKYEENGFRTSSGKVELYSDGLEKAGLDPLPVYREPPESPYSTPELARDYPLILTTGAKYPVFFHSEYRNVTWLREIAPENALEINPETASKLSIKHGDTVMVESLRGKMKVKASLSEGIDPRVVHVPHGWIGEANVNILTSDKPPYDPAMGTYQLRGILCRISKA